MSYEVALEKAWEMIKGPGVASAHEVYFMGDNFLADSDKQTIVSLSCNVPAKDYLSILILHYIHGTLNKRFSPSGEWVSFKEVDGGNIYYPAYREGAIIPLLKKADGLPERLKSAAGRFNGRMIDKGDVGIEIETFKDIFVRIILWASDEEFEADATILFDRNITGIFSMEDIAVFSRIVVGRI